MSKIKAGNIERGMYLLHHDQPYRVVKKKFVSPGKGSAFTRTKLENLETGSFIQHVFKSHDEIEQISVRSREMQFLYASNDKLVFMDPNSYEQIEVSAAVLGNKKDFLAPELKVHLLIYKDRPLAVSLPSRVRMTVAEAREAVTGDRSSAGTKPVKMETGLVVQVPLFIEKGETLLINTENGTYVSRA